LALPGSEGPAAGDGSVIRMRGIRRHFRVGSEVVRALDGIDLDVARGEFLACMGPSGSGKTTLLNVVGCLDTPTAGTYHLAGEEVSGFSEARLAEVRGRRIGFVFQSFHLVGRLTARRNVELPMVFAGVPRPERKGRVEAALEAVGLAARARHHPSQLSGGERQRVAIARAIVMEPDILLADEPTGNLDSASGAEVMRVLEERHGMGLTLILVTHNEEIACRTRRVVRLRDGLIVEDTLR